MRDRILTALNDYVRIVDVDINIAYDIAQDLNVIRALIKIENENLDRKLSIFERKLKEIGDIILPKDDAHDDVFHVKQPATTTIFQTADVRIIDIRNKKSALAKMEQAKKLVITAKEVIELSKSPTLSLKLKCDVHSHMTQLLNLLKLDGGLALQLEKDVNEAKDIFTEDGDKETLLENKLKMIKLKLEKCYREVQATQPAAEHVPNLVFSVLNQSNNVS
ncbi:hypothetical protein O3M35_007791 [Rhynocoris fuscipes]|uniref:Uncharacterized protein n=1 Tax=Rhynocoris fuscipes TaxID=488301 RepID=A0AAW1DHX0_9HEMI